MPYYDKALTEEQLKRMTDTHRCNECGSILLLAWGGYWDIAGYVLRCGNNAEHSTVAKKGRTAVKGKETYEEKLRREHEMAMEHGNEAGRALATIPRQGQLTQPQAEHILSLVYPGCPRDEVIRCAILCRDFGLHPLMKEVYLIKFGNTWATVLGINATRKLMAQRGTYSYIDDTPRMMTEDEQKRIFGEVDDKNIVAITKLRTKDGLEAPGYGKWPKDSNPYGTEKGNTKANMAFIRSERNAFGRLSPDALPEGVDVIDGAYVEIPDIGEVNTKTGEIVEEKPKPILEGEHKLVEEEPTEILPEPEPEPTDKDETSVTEEQIANIHKLLKESETDLAAFGKWCNKDKGWNIRDIKDLKAWQYLQICEAFKKGKA